MKTSSIAVLVSALALSLGATTACGSDDDDGGGKTTTGGSGGSTGGSGGTGGSTGGTAGATGGSGGTGGGTTPPPPALGAQLDRMGRPAINTALNKVIEADATAKQAGKTAYNQDPTASNWPTQYGAEFAKNLAVFDALDTICGNQLLYTLGDAGGSPYGGLAGALASDWIIVDTAKTACSYLGVEAPILGLGTANCGGRQLTDDVIDLSYSGLAAGTSGFPGGAPAVGDTIDANDKAFTATFPYLATPH